jgi:hypothetical protein
VKDRRDLTDRKRAVLEVRIGRTADIVLVDADWEVDACLVGGVAGYRREGIAVTA